MIEAAKAVAIPADREILHVLPQGIVDDQDGIRDPIGMSGVRAEAEVHIITGAAAACRNVIRAAERAGVRSRTWSRAARLGERGARARRARPGGRAPGHRRRHDRRRGLLRGSDPAHGGDRPGRLERHERPRDRAPHAGRAGRAPQAGERVRAHVDGASRGVGEGAERRRAPRSGHLPPHARHDDRAARRGDLRDGEPRDPEEPRRGCCWAPVWCSRVAPHRFPECRSSRSRFSTFRFGGASRPA